jgi:hypothetical protein
MIKIGFLGEERLWQLRRTMKRFFEKKKTSAVKIDVANRIKGWMNLEQPGKKGLQKSNTFKDS